MELTKLKTVMGIFGILTASMLLAGCNTDTETILKPIAEHIADKWNMTGNSILVDGEWEEQSNEDNVALAIEFRPDGTELRVMTFPDGFTALGTTTWSVDEATRVLTDNGPKLVHKLTDNELVLEADQSQNPGTGEITQKQSRWTYRRATEQDRTMAEWLAGKWQFSKTYEKRNGEWVETTFAVPDEATFTFHESGEGEMYTRKGENVQHSGGVEWSVNATTCELRLKKEENQNIQKIEKMDKDTLCVYYEGNKDAVTGETKDGEFKDVLVRTGK